MSKPFFVLLKNRGTVRITGEDRKKFLHGLITNSVEKDFPNEIVYACLLTPQGKFLHDMFIHDTPNALILDCEGGSRAKDLWGRLAKYKLRSKVEITCEETANVFAVFYATTGLPDPRHKQMGHRTFEKPDMEEKAFEEWDRLRISMTIPDGSRDMDVERSTLLECHIDKLNGVDWDKGCYMGQELTARLRYRALVKRHLYTVKIKGIAPVPFTDLPNGGNMRSSCDEIGLVLFKDDERMDVLECL